MGSHLRALQAPKPCKAPSPPSQGRTEMYPTARPTLAQGMNATWHRSSPAPELLYRSLPKSLQLLPHCQAAGQAKFCRVGRAPKGCHGAAPPNRGQPPQWGPTAEPKAASGFKAEQEGGQVLPSQGRGPGRGQTHMGCRDLATEQGSSGEQPPHGMAGSMEHPSEAFQLPGCPQRLRKSSFRYPFCKETAPSGTWSPSAPSPPHPHRDNALECPHS